MSIMSLVALMSFLTLASFLRGESRRNRIAILPPFAVVVVVAPSMKLARAVVILSVVVVARSHDIGVVIVAADHSIMIVMMYFTSG
jgi:hypothetical protein